VHGRRLSSSAKGPFVRYLQDRRGFALVVTFFRTTAQVMAGLAMQNVP